MAHLIYGHGQWSTVRDAWKQSTVITGTKDPESGDTFTDFTSSKGAVDDLAERGLNVEVLRTAMWGEKDYRIVE